jgi:hypothetical protein
VRHRRESRAVCRVQLQTDKEDLFFKMRRKEPDIWLEGHADGWMFDDGRPIRSITVLINYKSRWLSSCFYKMSAFTQFSPSLYHRFGCSSADPHQNPLITQFSPTLYHRFGCSSADPHKNPLIRQEAHYLKKPELVGEGWSPL